MPLTFYSPNSKNTGGALSVSFNSKNNAIYFKIIKQTAWNDATKKGTFKGGQIVNFLLSMDEVGSIINVIETNTKASFFHTFDGKPTATGQFNYWEIQSSDPSKESRKGFGVAIKKEGIDYKVALSVGAARNLKEYLIFALNHCYSAIYSEDKEFAKTSAEAKKQLESKTNGNKPSASPQKDTPPVDVSTEDPLGDEDLF